MSTRESARKTDKQRLSVLIPCYNSEDVIRPCLDSVAWADEILVCDSFSTDRTLAICREYTDRIIQHRYVNSATQKNWAIPQCRNEWVLIVDTDETLEPGMREEIAEIIRTAAPDVAGFQIPRKNFVYGRWMRHGGQYPDLQLRLFRKGHASYEQRDVHAHMVAIGKVSRMRHHILHNGFKDTRVWLLKNERYLRYECEEYTKMGRTFSLWKAMCYPTATFAKTYIYQKGFLDGWGGLLTAVLKCFYHFMIFAKLWERMYRKKYLL